MFNIKSNIVAAAAILCCLIVPAKAETYNFVRIQGLAEQAVGEELLKEVYKRAGIDMTIEAMPGKRALAEASAGRKDGETLRVYALGENVKSLIRVPTPLSSLETVAFAKNDGVNGVTADKLGDYTTAVVAGVLHTEAITKGLDNVNVVRSPEQLFTIVSKERAQLALTSNLDGRAELKRTGLNDIVMLEPALKELPLYHYVHESKADKLVPVIDKIVKEMTESGELAELRAKLEADYLANQ
ncbi:transporter substrate-binding domain-containing protein [Roseibium sp. HPY-6]|uniref:substrate-binding periplasmic protein n=1 Tax=Roseibium sp. HPY-6 TaxID=3229852 RepID=UPI00338D9810